MLITNIEIYAQVEAYGPDPTRIRVFPEAGIFDLGANYLMKYQA
jgi:hypothetical protein